jgi:broad specificity phosphatase PhoE
VRSLAQAIKEQGLLRDVSLLLSSPLTRALESARLLSDALGGLDPVVDPGWAEIDPGEADGISWEDFEVLYGPFDPLSNPDKPLAPGGESWSLFSARVEDALRRVASLPDEGSVVVACHAGVILAVQRIMGSPGDLLAPKAGEAAREPADEEAQVVLAPNAAGLCWRL